MTPATAPVYVDGMDTDTCTNDHIAAGAVRYWEVVDSAGTVVFWSHNLRACELWIGFHRFDECGARRYSRRDAAALKIEPVVWR